MKLIRCPDCSDVIALTGWRKVCACGKTYGQYIGKTKAKVSPNAIVMAMDTRKFRWKTENDFWEHDGSDIEFVEFQETIPSPGGLHVNCPVCKELLLLETWLVHPHNESYIKRAEGINV